MLLYHITFETLNQTFPGSEWTTAGLVFIQTSLPVAVGYNCHLDCCVSACMCVCSLQDTAEVMLLAHKKTQ